MDKYFEQYPVLLNNNDSHIIAEALSIKETNPDLIFVTNDLICKKIAKAVGLNVEYKKVEFEQEYKGYNIFKCNNDNEVANVYNSLWQDNFLQDIGAITNQYFIIQNGKDMIDAYKYTEDKTLEQVEFKTFESKHLGKVKPMDKLQLCAMDSLENNKLTVIGGPGGAGKSLLSMAYLFQQLEKGKIDHIIIFCNTVATSGSAKLGYYPGSRTEKLMDSQIGNFLISKIGGREEVDKLIDHDEIILLPMSDLRGFDTSGMNAGIYITEAQNMDIELMKLALQRIGDDSFCILDGDWKTQVDMSQYAGDNNGLKRVSEVFKGQPFFGQVNLEKIYRSKIAAIADTM